MKVISLPRSNINNLRIDALLRILLMVILLLPGCGSAPQQSQILSNTSASPGQLSEANQIIPQSSDIEKVIWSGKSSGLLIKWTTADLFVQSEAITEKIFYPLVKKGVEDFAAIQVESNQTREKTDVINCEYERNFKVLSIVGTLLSFEDQYYDNCGGAHPSVTTRFTAIDLAKQGEVVYALSEDTPMMDVDLANLGKIVKLTDYFAEQDILQALLNDRVIKRAIAALDVPTIPRTLTELPEMFAEEGYGLGEYDFELRPDFLTRFTFHHIEGDKVAIRIGLPPHFGAIRAQHGQLGLLLPIPASLRQSFALAATRKEGFLMKDARIISANLTTGFKLKTRVNAS